MKITFLGTSSGAPSRMRNVSSIALQWSHDGSLWLFDCGEGTQHQILRSPLRLSHLERLFFSHLHGDHLFGAPGLLATRSAQAGGVTPVTLYGCGRNWSMRTPLCAWSARRWRIVSRRLAMP